MSITLNFDEETEAQLRAQAAKFGKSVEEYLQRYIQEDVVVPPLKTGAEILSWLEHQGVIGAWADRTDITDSVEFARQLRKQAETREHCE